MRAEPRPVLATTNPFLALVPIRAELLDVLRKLTNPGSHFMPLNPGAHIEDAMLIGMGRSVRLCSSACSSSRDAATANEVEALCLMHCCLTCPHRLTHSAGCRYAIVVLQAFVQARLMVWADLLAFLAGRYLMPDASRALGNRRVVCRYSSTPSLHSSPRWSRILLCRSQGPKASEG